MLKPAAATAQTELEMVTPDQRVPREHPLRLINAHIRFDFIREKTEGLYCANNGCLAIDPVLRFKVLLSAACQNTKKIALLLARRAAALFKPKFWLCGAACTPSSPQ